MHNQTNVRARNTDPSTSHAAAQAITHAAPGIEQDILDILSEFPGGLTIQEIADITGINLVTISPRIAPLRRRGQVHSIGKRKNPSGHMALIWTLGEGPISTAPSPARAPDRRKKTPTWLDDHAAFLHAAADLLEVIDKLSISE